MEAFLRAAGDFIAAILRGLGFVGRPRRRAEIRADLELLKLVGESDIGKDSQGHRLLAERVEKDIARLCGNRVEGDRKRPVGSIITGLVLGLPSAYWTYWLVRDGFEWLAILPGSIAFVLLVGTLNMLISGEEDEGTKPAAPAT